MALRNCPECGHQVSDRAATCPGCGAPNVTPVVIPNAPPQVNVAEPSLEAWALSRLTSGSSRRQVVEELVAQGTLARANAETLVAGVEAAALGPPRKSKTGMAVLLVVILLVFIMFMLLAAG